jgi:hypothetical protein
MTKQQVQQLLHFNNHPSSLTLCLSQLSIPVQTSHGLLLLMVCLLACLIPTVPVRAWVDWCP